MRLPLSKYCFLAQSLAVLLSCSINVCSASYDYQIIDSEGEHSGNLVIELHDLAPVNRPDNTATMDQRNKRFNPEVVAIAPGGKIVFPNSDASHHHVYSFSKSNSFELELYDANDAPPVLFENPGVVALGCNIHDAMIGYIYISTAPVFIVSDTTGKISTTINLKEYNGRITFWHPSMSTAMPLNITDSSNTNTITLPKTFKNAGLIQKKTTSSLEDRLKRFTRNNGNSK